MTDQQAMNPEGIRFTPAEVTVLVHPGARVCGVRHSKFLRVGMNRQYAKDLIKKGQARGLEETYVLRRAAVSGVAEIVTSCELMVERVVNARLDLMRHSPTGFEWGYAGSGPAQAALALCADALRDEDALAVAVHQELKARLLLDLPKSGGLFSAAYVLGVIGEIVKDRAR